MNWLSDTDQTMNSGEAVSLEDIVNKAKHTVDSTKGSLEKDAVANQQAAPAMAASAEPTSHEHQDLEVGRSDASAHSLVSGSVNAENSIPSEIRPFSELAHQDNSMPNAVPVASHPDSMNESFTSSHDHDSGGNPMSNPLNAPNINVSQPPLAPRMDAPATVEGSKKMLRQVLESPELSSHDSIEARIQVAALKSLIDKPQELYIGGMAFIDYFSHVLSGAAAQQFAAASEGLIIHGVVNPISPTAQLVQSNLRLGQAMTAKNA